MGQGKVNDTALNTTLMAALALALAPPAVADVAAAPPAPSPGAITPLAPALPVTASQDGSVPISANSVLPPLPTIGLGAADTPLGVLRGVQFSGNSAIGASALDGVVAPFLNRSVLTSDLVLLRDQVAAYYQSTGYLATRVSLRRATLDDGILRLDVREGTLASAPCVRILKTGTHASSQGCESPDTPATESARLRVGYVLARLPAVQSAPLNINSLRDSLGALQRDPRIARLEAAITPTALGDADLALTVWEAPPWRLAGEVSNHVSPSLGEVLGTVEF
ncbi:MAG: POTRA domain-containing protein, partial [Pseudomonadota bacterium]